MHPYCGKFWSVLSRQWVTVSNDARYAGHLKVTFANGGSCDVETSKIRHTIESRLFESYRRNGERPYDYPACSVCLINQANGLGGCPGSGVPIAYRCNQCTRQAYDGA